MPYPEQDSESEALPRFLKQAFVIHANIDNERHALTWMVNSIERFLRSHLQALLDTDEIKAMLTMRHELKHLWLSFTKEEKRAALDEYEQSIHAVYSQLNKRLAQPPTSIPKIFYTEIIEQQLIINIKSLLTSCLERLTTQLPPSNQLLIDLTESQVGIAESYELTAQSYAFIQDVFLELKSHFLQDEETALFLDETITRLDEQTSSLSQHLRKVIEERHVENQTREQKWHQYHLQQLNTIVDTYLDYIQSPDTAGSRNFTGFALFDEKTHRKLRHYRISQNVKDRIRTIKLFQVFLKKQTSLNTKLIRTFEKTLSELIDAEVEDPDEVLSIEKEHFKSLASTYFTFKERLESKCETHIKHALKSYLAYLDECTYPKRRLINQLERQLMHQDDSALLNKYPHWQVVIDRQHILKAVSNELPNAEFSWITMLSLNETLTTLKEHDIEDERYVLAGEAHHYRTLEIAIGTLKQLNEDYVFKESKALIKEYRDYLSHEISSEISPENQYAKLIDEYTLFLAESSTTQGMTPISFDEFIRLKTIRASAYDALQDETPTPTPFNFFRDKKAYLTKDGYKRHQVVKNRLACLQTLYEELSDHTETTPRAIFIIKYALSKLENEKVEDFDHVFQQESCLYAKLKKHVTRLEQRLKAAGQKDIREIVRHYIDFLDRKMRKGASPSPSILHETDKRSEGYQHWQVVKDRFVIVEKLHKTLTRRKALSTDEMKRILENTIKQLKEAHVLDKVHVFPEEIRFFDSLEQALLKLSPYHDYIPFASTYFDEGLSLALSY